MTMGRPPEYKPEFCDLLAEHLKEGLSFDSFGGVVFVSRQTLYNWTKQYPDFLDTKTRFETASLLEWERVGKRGTVGEIENFNCSAWIFNMKNRFKWRDKSPEEAAEDKAFVLAYEVKKKSKEDKK